MSCVIVIFLSSCISFIAISYVLKICNVCTRDALNKGNLLTYVATLDRDVLKHFNMQDIILHLPRAQCSVFCIFGQTFSPNTKKMQ